MDCECPVASDTCGGKSKPGRTARKQLVRVKLLSVAHLAEYRTDMICAQTGANVSAAAVMPGPDKRLLSRRLQVGSRPSQSSSARTAMAAALGLTPTFANCESSPLDVQLRLLESCYSAQTWQNQCRKTAQRRSHRQDQGRYRRPRCSLDQGSNGASKSSPDVPLASDSPESAPFTVAMKFGGSSLATADRMQEVARVISSFPNESPIIVLSAMGKTTNLLLQVNYHQPPDRRKDNTFTKLTVPSIQ